MEESYSTRIILLSLLPVKQSETILVLSKEKCGEQLFKKSCLKLSATKCTGNATKGICLGEERSSTASECLTWKELVHSMLTWNFVVTVSNRMFFFIVTGTTLQCNVVLWWMVLPSGHVFWSDNHLHLFLTLNQPFDMEGFAQVMWFGTKWLTLFQFLLLDLTETGFKQSKADPCIYAFKNVFRILILIVQVDDWTVGHSSSAVVAFSSRTYQEKIKHTVECNLIDYSSSKIFLASNKTRTKAWHEQPHLLKKLGTYLGEQLSHLKSVMFLARVSYPKEASGSCPGWRHIDF